MHPESVSASDKEGNTQKIMVHPQSVSASYKEDNATNFRKCGRENFQNGIQI